MAKMNGLNVLKCYGKQKLRKIKGVVDRYEGECGKQCPWRDACISASREDGEFRHDQYEILPLNTALADFAVAEPSQSRLFPESWMSGVEEDTKAAVWKHVQDLLHRIAHMYLTAPRQFDASMRYLFAGESQAEQARLNGVTRQAINAGLLLECAGSNKANITIPRPLRDEKERIVYLLYFLDGCTMRSVAKQVHMPTTTVCRLVQKIRSKLAKNGTVKKRIRKKNQKNLKKNEVAKHD